MENPTPYDELTPETWGHEKLSSEEAEKICLDILKEEEASAAERIKAINSSINCSLVLGATAVSLAFFENTAASASTADWYAPALRKAASVAEEGIGALGDVSLGGTALLNWLIAGVGIAHKEVLKNKLHSLAEKIKQTS